MHSKNKKAPTVKEKKHIQRIAEQNCVICDAPGPSEVHEIKQGLWWASIPLCADCHRGQVNGLHGQKRIWSVMKMDELDALALTTEKLYG